jgi:hypothetical protein
MEQQIIAAFAAEGYQLERAHSYQPELQHGFIYSQRMGLRAYPSGCTAGSGRGGLAV